MSVDELHPDELLRRARHGGLSDVEARQLAAHVAGCSVCAFERLAGRDFAAETAAAPGDDAWLAGVLDAVTGASAPGRAASDGATTAPAPTPIRRRPPSVRWLLMAAILCVSAAAAAARQLHWFARSAAAPPAVARAHVAHEAIATTALVAPPPTVPAPPSAPAIAPSERVVPAPRASVRAAIVPASRAATDLAPDTAAELYARANHARRDGDPGDAVASYRALQRRFPDSPQALQSRVALGRVLLDRLGDPAAALDAFDRYLAGAPRGDESEAALVGRALALRRLHRGDDERRAWAQLLRTFPDSMYADQARAAVAGTAP